MATILVSARMPQAKKEAAVRVLDSLGVTVSDLINQAFDFVLEEHRLPEVGAPGRPARDSFASFMDATTLEVAWPADDAGDYKAMLREGMLHDYESLA